MENRVLVEDDEKETRASINKVLRRPGGFHGALAETAEEALHQELVEYIHYFG